ncbi:mRNA-decapping enzyme subunit 2 [Xylographa opegraphella]|nr:mRNA-decapping enzyme subunit 2 [Xylographa opegraphella]
MTETKMQLEDWLDDLCVRFIVNLPKEELESVERICFQVEEAQWFYEDFIRPLDPNLPSLNLRQFCLRIFQHCPLLSGFSPYHHATAFSEFLAYKTRVPVRGAIMLNEAMDEVVLVKGWKKNANWSFPRGKINKDEKDLHCAIREVYEETGFDVQSAKLVPDKQDVKYIEVTMREQHMRLYVFRGIPMDTDFEPRTRKEISKIQWYKLSELPTLKKMKQQQQDGHGGDMTINANKFYMVAPFLSPLKKWISQQKKLDAINSQNRNKVSPIPPDAKLEEEQALFSDLPANSKSDDMNRLMTQLRQSGKMGSTSNAIELSGSSKGPNDASIQLKNLLNVPSTTMGSNPNMNKHNMARDGKANAMLSLLRSGAPGTGYQKMDGSVELPQTPFEQILELPRMPPSPKHESVRRYQLPTMVSPPAFPVSPNHFGLQRPQQPHFKTSNSAHVSALPIETLHEQAGTIPSQFHTSPPFVAAQHNHHALAPYQRTGDPRFAHGPHASQNLPPSIPPANALPPPKLTSHSSVLLDIFRSGSLSKSSAQTIPSPGMAPTHTSLSHRRESDHPSHEIIQAQSPVQQVLNIQSSPDIAQSTSSVPALQQGPTVAMHPRSHQQEALLSIFRTASSPIATKSHSSSPSLAPPTTLVELSAQPSPSHSRVSSEVKTEEPNLPLRNGHVRIQKRPEPVRKASQGPLTATVTGPLNFPQFDKVVRPPKISATNVTNGSDNVHDDLSTTNQRSMTILPRPLAHNLPTGDQSITAPKIKGPAPKKETKAVAHKARTAVKEEPPTKPFHPQILRRPAREESISIFPSSQPPITAPSAAITIGPAASPYQSSPLVTKDNFFLDRRSSQTQEQKTALLSLFSKTSTTSSAMLPPPTPTRVPAVSPVSENPTRTDTTVPSRSSSILPSPLDIARSRVDSWNSFIADGEKSAVLGSTSGKQTPKPSPVDKKFLLGFLDGVVREGAK